MKKATTVWSTVVEENVILTAVIAVNTLLKMYFLRLLDLDSDFGAFTHLHLTLFLNYVKSS